MAAKEDAQVTSQCQETLSATAYETAQSTMEKENGKDASTSLTEQNSPDAAIDLQSAQELTDYFRDLLVQTQNRFAMMSDQIMKKIDDMADRLNNLETDINSLITGTLLEDSNK